MQLLEEKKSADGLVLAKIFADGDYYIVEKWLNNELVLTTRLGHGRTLNEASAHAASWLGSVTQLNG